MLDFALIDSDNRISTFTDNVGNVFSYGGSINFSINPVKKWQITTSSNLNLSNVSLIKQVYVSTTSLYSANVSLSNRYSFNKKLNTELSIRMMNYTRSLSEVSQPMLNLTFQFNYVFPGDRLTISLLGHDLFFTMINRETIIPNDQIEHNMTSKSRSRFIQGTLRYKFGKSEKNRSRKLGNEKIQFSNG